MKITTKLVWYTIRHGLFWFTVWLMLGLFFSVDTWQFEPIDRWYAAFYLPGLVATVYLTRYVIVPFLRTQKKPILFYFMLLSFAVACGKFMHEFIFSIGETALDQFYFGEYNEWESIGVNVLIQAAALGLHLSRSWYQQQTKIRDIQQARLQSEVRLLRSQLEPHFLFNSLNSLYALALKQDPHTPQAILELAELLRYVQLSSTRKEVLVQEEWDFLLKYKNIQSLRLNKEVELMFESVGRLEEKKIVPLLLINSVENAFKHFQAPVDGKGCIRVFLQLQANELTLTVQNSYRSEEEHKKIGTGLAHLKKQLLIHYPGKHHIGTEAGSTLFISKLNIDLS